MNTTNLWLNHFRLVLKTNRRAIDIGFAAHPCPVVVVDSFPHGGNPGCR